MRNVCNSYVFSQLVLVGENDAAKWARLNRAFKKNSRRWSLSSPGPRLALMQAVMRATAHMVNKALQLSGAQWDRQRQLQAAQGKARSYRVVEAAKGSDLNNFYRALLEQLEQAPTGLPTSATTADTLKTYFCMLSRAGCSMHALLRRMRQGEPYKLFQMLVHGQRDKYNTGPACLRDELSHAFYTRFPQWTPDAEAALRCLAESIDLDVAQIESKHALSRRIAVMKGLQTWTPKLEALSADWSHRQANRHEEHIYGKDELQSIAGIGQCRGGEGSCEGSGQTAWSKGRWRRRLSRISACDPLRAAVHVNFP